MGLLTAGAVEFEAAGNDPFGLGDFFGDAKGGRKNALDAIGKGGHMRAGGAGGASFEEYAQGGAGKKMEFSRGK